MHQLRVKRPQQNEPPPQANKTGDTLSNTTPSQLAIQKGLKITEGQQTATKAGVPEPPKFRCRYHPGQLLRKVSLKHFVSR
jgi:hypothetical protein